MNRFPSVLLLAFPLLLCSCIVPASNHIEPTYHLLSDLQADGNNSSSLTGVSFFVRQVELPPYLQENRLVSRPKLGLIEFDENNRWGEPLEEGVARVVGLNLADRLKSLSYSVYPHRKKTSCLFELGITIKRFERIDKDSVLLEVLCEVDSKEAEQQLSFSSKFEFDSNSENEPGLVVLGLSHCLAHFCDFVVAEINSRKQSDPVTPAP